MLFWLIKLNLCTSTYALSSLTRISNRFIKNCYFITDINLSYSFSSGIETGCIVQNVFNTAWNETQFATESRLRTEPESVTEIHFTPGTPFNGRLFLRYKF